MFYNGKCSEIRTIKLGGIQNMKIGCVKEIKNNEFRVGLTPDNVKAYVAAGHHV